MRAGDLLRLRLAYSSVNAVRFVGGMSKSGGIPYVSTRLTMGTEIQHGYGDEQARAGWYSRSSRDQILRREQGQGNVNFPCSSYHEQDRQPYLVDPHSCYMWDHTYIHTYISRYMSEGRTLAGVLVVECLLLRWRWVAWSYFRQYLLLCQRTISST